MKDVHLFSEDTLFSIHFRCINSQDVNSLFVFPAQFCFQNILFHKIHTCSASLSLHDYWWSLIIDGTKNKIGGSKNKSKNKMIAYFFRIHFTVYCIGGEKIWIFKCFYHDSFIVTRIHSAEFNKWRVNQRIIST